MSKIANWVFGSFFRTIGRLLVFILLGVIIAHFIDFGSIKDNFSITDLFLDKVRASSYGNLFVPSATYNNQSLSLDGGYYNITTSVNNGWSSFDRFDFPKQTLSSTANELYVNVRLSKMTEQYDTTDFNQNYTISCTATNTYHELGSADPYQTDYEYSLNTLTCNVPSQYGSSDINEKTILINAFYIYEQNNNSLAAPCYLNSVYEDNIVYKCPVVSNNITGIRFRAYSKDTFNYKLGFSPYISYSLDKAQEQINAINQQTQQQQQQHQETMNSTTTEAESEATSFFGDFEDQDFGGLSGIVTAPLNTIRSLLSSTCTNLVLPLPFVNEDLTLPCMTSIYTEHFGAFFTLYQTIILAIVAYRCIRSIFYDVHGFTNPDDDRIEVMDL